MPAAAEGRYRLARRQALKLHAVAAGSGAAMLRLLPFMLLPIHFTILSLQRHDASPALYDKTQPRGDAPYRLGYPRFAAAKEQLQRWRSSVQAVLSVTAQSDLTIFIICFERIEQQRQSDNQQPGCALHFLTTDAAAFLPPYQRDADHVG